MPHYKKLFDPRFIGSWDLNGDTNVVMKSMSIEEMNDPDDAGSTVQRPVVAFENAKKGWVLNATNAATIAKLHGTDTDDWRGKKITIYPTTCKAFGAVVDCIRVKEKVPK
jgi:hypothetical protein